MVAAAWEDAGAVKAHEATAAAPMVAATTSCFRMVRVVAFMSFLTAVFVRMQ
jgi:hypothetical protein